MHAGFLSPGHRAKSLWSIPFVIYPARVHHSPSWITSGGYTSCRFPWTRRRNWAGSTSEYLSTIFTSIASSIDDESRSARGSHGRGKGDYLYEFFIVDLSVAVDISLADHLINLIVGQFLSYRLCDTNKRGPTRGQSECLPRFVMTCLNSAALM